MDRRLVLWSGLLLTLVWVICLYVPQHHATARSEPNGVTNPELQMRTELPAPRTEVCEDWKFEMVEGTRLDPELEEMSGIAYSRHWKNLLYHIADSGNAPLLLLTRPSGELLQKIPYAERSSDPEDLDVGTCPWGGSCIYVADTGDNFHLRRERQVIIIDEPSLLSPQPKKMTLRIEFPDRERIDVEALAVHPKNGSLYLFSKVKKRSRVFELPQPWNTEVIQAREIAVLKKFDHITGAQFHPLGDRLLLINWQGAIELSEGPRPAFQREARSWYPYQRKISIPPSVQPEAIAYSLNGLSLVYSSEKKKWSKKWWGMVSGQCLTPMDRGEGEAKP